MMNAEIDNFRKDLRKSIEILSSDLSKIRTGRASSSMVDFIEVEAYEGQKLRLQELARVVVEGPKTIRIEPWDKTTVKVISDALMNSLNLSPQSGDETIRINLPDLTSERRRDLEKTAREVFEQFKISLRNKRQGAIKKFEQENEGNEDLVKGFKNKADDAVKEIEQSGKKLLDEKVQEILNG